WTTARNACERRRHVAAEQNALEATSRIRSTKLKGRSGGRRKRVGTFAAGTQIRAPNAPARSLPAVPPPGRRRDVGRPPGWKGGAEGSPPPTPAVLWVEGRGGAHTRSATRILHERAELRMRNTVWSLRIRGLPPRSIPCTRRHPD